MDGSGGVEGYVPEVLEGLVMPTHVFIGGSSGNLRQIIEKVTDANPEVKIVLNAISLETLGEVMELSKDGLLKEIQEKRRLCNLLGVTAGLFLTILIL